jgi:hypothetical protein
VCACEWVLVSVYVCVRACACVRVRACVRVHACLRECRLVCEREGGGEGVGERERLYVY